MLSREKMRIKTTTKQDLIHILILLTIALGLGIYLICTTVVIAKDGVGFIEYAKNLEVDAAKTMIEQDEHSGYPAMILGAHKISRLFIKDDSVFSWIYCAQSIAMVFRLLAIVVLYFIGKNLVGAKFSFLAVLILIFLPKPASYGSDGLSDWPHMFFLVAGFLLLTISAKEGKWLLFGLTGLSAGFGYLVRPECAQVIIYALLWLGLQLVWTRRTLSRSKAVLSLALLLVGFLIVAGPHMRLKGTISFEKQAVEVGTNTQANEVHISGQQVVSNTANIVPPDIGAGFAKLVENVGETLMWFFVPALLIGMYKSFKNVKWYEPEQFFMSVIIVFNVPLMIWLYCSAGYMSVRHTLSLVVFTVFYIPAGMYVLADLLNKKVLKKENSNLGFVILMVIGIAICSPKLFRPLHYDKVTVRKAAQWLAENSETNDLIGSADPRVGFYAERNSIYCDGIIVPQEVRYVVKIFKNQKNTATDNLLGRYRKVFSFEDDVKKRLVVIYEKPL